MTVSVYHGGELAAKEAAYGYSPTDVEGAPRTKVRGALTTSETHPMCHVLDLRLKADPKLTLKGDDRVDRGCYHVILELVDARETG
jgi:hypothetical protein